tara:strand:+ start:322 stop:486 length:165 start_codon:yes stop_codon:yes gene_type:complete
MDKFLLSLWLYSHISVTESVKSSAQFACRRIKAFDPRRTSGKVFADGCISKKNE